jgi:hypothetical protein
MLDTGKVDKYCQLQRSRIYSSNHLPGISSSLVILPETEFQGALKNNPREFDYGKRCETREKITNIVNSRGLASLLVNNSQEYHDFQ